MLAGGQAGRSGEGIRGQGLWGYTGAMSFRPRIDIDLGLLVLRLWFGLVMAFGHGLGKVLNLRGFIAGVERAGFVLPQLLGPLAAASELVGGLLIAVGFFARSGALFLLGTMLGAAFVRHAHDPFARKELALAYGVVALVVLVAGPGRYTLARMLGMGAKAPGAL